MIRTSSIRMVRYAPWLIVVAIPLLLNYIVWTQLLTPLRNNSKNLSQAKSLVEIKPALENLLSETDQRIQNWQSTALIPTDKEASVREIQQLAGINGVQIKKIERKASSAFAAPSEFVATDIEMEVSGTFNKLARWISAMEETSFLQISKWSLKSLPDSTGNTITLTVKAISK